MKAIRLAAGGMLIGASLLQPAHAQKPETEQSHAAAVESKQAEMRQEVQKLITQLGDNEFLVREKAGEDLRKLLRTIVENNEMDAEIRSMMQEKYKDVETDLQLDYLVKIVHDDINGLTQEVIIPVRRHYAVPFIGIYKTVVEEETITVDVPRLHWEEDQPRKLPHKWKYPSKIKNRWGPRW